MSPRFYAPILITDGLWTNVDGTQSLSPALGNPANIADTLIANDNVPTFVIAIGGDGEVQMMADGLSWVVSLRVSNGLEGGSWQ